jgi:periplasmic divalent cation tolerance protein
MPEFIVVFVTVGSSAEGRAIAHALVEEGLAACVNRIPGIRSIYRWEGKIEESEEELLLIKTRAEIFSNLEKRIRELHSYSVPEIIAVPVVSGNEAYLSWLKQQVSNPAS